PLPVDCFFSVSCNTILKMLQLSFCLSNTIVIEALYDPTHKDKDVCLVLFLRSTSSVRALCSKAMCAQNSVIRCF
ncbi:MAG: hypothetical protein IIY06_03240, partial [Proteobacteria bacterium]|nr:hypothetical protein [Pseudomonadota bacterium]